MADELIQGESAAEPDVVVPQHKAMSVADMWQGIEVRTYVVMEMQGKPSKPKLLHTYYERARDPSAAIEAVKRRCNSKARGGWFRARLAHPVRDLGCVPADSSLYSASDDSLLQVGGSAGWRVHCKCGHSDDFWSFCISPGGVELPVTDYQCPKCYSAWRLGEIRQASLSAEGGYIPAGPIIKRILPRQ
ncbi:hypothetical protein [Metapseudomonas otitidis]|uniref:hypothetical protein n=1 Tax=Metapseudomonas otitidis TaxID=319939 RepID=UPI0013DFE24B|nr:hypothetical protein [Pseudomonas otitidis]